MVKDASNITKPRKTMQQAIGFNFYDVFVVGFCVIFALICFYPMWYVLVASVTPYEQFVKGGALLWPNGGVDFQYYRMIFENSSFVTSLWISASKTVLGTFLSVLVTSTMAYAVSKVYVPGMKLLNVLTVFTMFFAGGLIPTFLTVKSLGLYNNPWVMVILGATSMTNIIISRTFFETNIPNELREAAEIDGCSNTRFFFSIVLPILQPSLISTGILQAMWIWNDYLLPYLVLDLKRFKTIPIAVQYLRGGYGSVDMGAMMGMLVLAIAPILVMYFLCQKYIVSGVMAGAVKG